MKERRIFCRVQFVADVRLTFENKVFAGELLDLSLKGALMRPTAEFPIAVGHKGELSFFLTSSETTLQFTVELVHTHEKHLGFRFLSEDIDSITHLRRLIELNVGDDAPVTHELAFLTKT